MLDEIDLINVEFCINKVVLALENEFDKMEAGSIGCLRLKHKSLLDTLEKVRKM